MTEASPNSPEKPILKPGTLWTKTKQQTEFARKSGALHSTKTEYQFIEQDNISFIVHSLSNLVKKNQERKKQTQQERETGKRVDPFLPYEEDLFVCDISPTHICLLNKFNVVDNHLLIVTRAFEEQTELLNLRDFVALWACIQEIDGLAFFNGGKIAGASQRHKHLQLVPLPLVPDLDSLPIESAIATATFENSIGQTSHFPFRHAIASLNLTEFDNPITAAQTILDCYYSLLEAVGFNLDKNNQEQPGAYNFLATRNWLAVVPRSQHAYQSIPINSLGFAGSLFVRDRHSLELLKELTPMTILRKVSLEKDEG